MFKQPCFIRNNTPELRDLLKDLGQRENTLDDFSNEWLAANYGMFISVSEGFQNLHPKDIDCEQNEDLFLALAAFRDDSDKFQWFTDGINWYFCNCNKFSEYWLYNNISVNLDTIHKASVEELIEHLKSK